MASLARRDSVGQVTEVCGASQPPFLFQAEDGIRDLYVTGVQTCALPICGSGDPPGFRVDDCATQRNLSAKGRADAARIGARLRSEGTAVERILSSPWCRCMDTATLLELGPVEAEQTFGNVVVLSDQRESLIAGARAVIDKWTGSGI